MDWTHPIAGAERAWVDVGGHRHAVVRAGAGTPLLLVHGIMTYSFIWRRLFSELAQHHSVTAVDLLGCGESDKPLDISYGLAARAERVAALIGALGSGRVHLIGHDLGGGIGQLAAVRFTDRIRSLTLLNSVAFDYWPVQPILGLRAPVLRKAMMATLDLGALSLLVRRGLHYPERATPELLALFRRPFQTAEGRRALLHFARCLDNRDLCRIGDRLAHLKLPTLIVRGDADRYLEETSSLRLSATIPGARLERIPTAGHFLQEDEPELLTRVILAFVRSVDER